jgi:DNA-binding transcriptional MerR regulator
MEKTRPRQALRTSHVIDATGIGREALRFYERKGLVRAKGRTSSGYREFSPDVIRRIAFIKEAQEAGFSLREILELLRFREASTATCGNVSKALARKIEQLDAELAKLRSRKAILSRVHRVCASQASDESCGMLP